jgi:hypothetical protein
MDPHEGPQTTLTIALNEGQYLAIKVDSYEGPQTALTIALLGGL